ncbi:MAG: methylmalonyl Co-A mutase-associated GTPase MeaB [Thermoplasmata archaeon]|nr:methylmalonyl Co-A mutase-associated GTPase MeaB [Thermoplasmata archaeon]
MTRAPALPTPARRILEGDRRALAQAISAVEAHDPAIAPVVGALYSHSGKARIVGLTGPLGVGKSSLINALLKRLRAQGRKVGVIAVDPSSPFSGGSVLGDRIRIDRPAGDAGVFFRSMASRGHAGGIAATTRSVARLLDAFGMDVILVETVGSGQVDVEVRDVASTSVVVLVPHLGDEVQTLKAGLFEIADVFCVNKGELAGADAAAKDLTELAGLGIGRDGWRPPVVTTSAPSGSGIDELWAAIEAHETFLDTSRLRDAGERRRLSREVVQLVQERVATHLAAALESEPDLSTILDRVVARELDPQAAADLLHSGRPRRG